MAVFLFCDEHERLSANLRHRQHRNSRGRSGAPDYDRPDQYEKLFPTMVKRWRQLWGQGDFPFYYAQIAPYDYAQLPPYNAGGKYNSAYLRDAQRKSLSTIPNSGMAVLMDIGEQATIHPPRKEQMGTRQAT